MQKRTYLRLASFCIVLLSIFALGSRQIVTADGFDPSLDVRVPARKSLADANTSISVVIDMAINEATVLSPLIYIHGRWCPGEIIA